MVTCMMHERPCHYYFDYIVGSYNKVYLQKKVSDTKGTKRRYTSIVTYIIVVTVSSLKKRNEDSRLKYKTIDDTF